MLLFISNFMPEELFMNETKQNALSVSLPNRSIYAVCYTPKDGIAAFTLLFTWHADAFLRPVKK